MVFDGPRVKVSAEPYQQKHRIQELLPRKIPIRGRLDKRLGRRAELVLCF